MKNLTCTSWLSGKHTNEIEINTKLPFVSYNDLFIQGEEAEEVINEINLIYNSKDITVLEAIELYFSERY